MATTAAGSAEGAHEEGVRRRDWIHIAALSTAGVGGASVLFPLITQMAPTADVLAASTTDVDVSAIEEGQSIKATFRDQPLFVKRLTPAEIAEAQAEDGVDMRDPETLADRLGELVDDIDAYEAPEIMPNGDIIIRRKPDADPHPDAPVANPDGSIDL